MGQCFRDLRNVPQARLPPVRWLPVRRTASFRTVPLPPATWPPWLAARRASRARHRSAAADSRLSRSTRPSALCLRLVAVVEAPFVAGASRTVHGARPLALHNRGSCPSTTRSARRCNRIFPYSRDHERIRSRISRCIIISIISRLRRCCGAHVHRDASPSPRCREVALAAVTLLVAAAW